MAFDVIYSAGGELEKVKKVGLIEKINNFAQLPQPYNKMRMMNVPAITGVYNMEYVTPDEEVELVSIVVTCSGYGENDYYNIYANGELWFDTWYPTEVKEGLYIGTSTYVCVIPATTKIRLEFFNMSGTSKKVWLGVRMLRKKTITSQTNGPIEDVDTVAVPTSTIDTTTTGSTGT